MPVPLLQLERIEKSFGGEGTVRADVLRGVDLTLEAGESLAIIGPSGSGKSSLLNIMGTLEPPTSGLVRFEGTNLASLGEKELAAFRNEEIGFVFQHHHLLPQCSALENVLVPTLARPGSRGDEKEGRARELLERVGLGERVDHRPAQLSGGERQRVAVVRALINAPRLLLADEPTGALDSVAAEALGDLLVELNERDGVALVVVTHALSLAERMKRVLHLADGVLVEDETSGARTESAER